MAVHLAVVSGPIAHGNAIPLSAPEVTIGADAANLVVLADPAVAPRHCVLVQAAGALTLRDLDPANPSFINGLPAAQQPLRPGDQIQIGSSLFVLMDSPPEPAAG